MGRRTCECGECAKCKRREYMNNWYRTPGTAERVRGWAKRYREQNIELVRQKDRERGYRVYDSAKVSARRLARVVSPKPCERCGATPAERHHPDYEKPLDVVFLCKSCHGLVHRTVA